MSVRQRKALKALAVILAFSFAQVYIQTSLAEPGTNGGPVPIPQQFVARLATRGNQPITVNGATAASGATILTGATIETPDQVGATIDFGALGTLDIAPNTKLMIEFDQNGAKIKLISGCAILRTRKNHDGEIDTDQGVAAKNDKKKGGVADVCFPPGATSPTVNAGAAANAGAGAGGGAAAGAAAGGGAGGLFGLGGPATVAIIGGGAATAAILGTRGTNPSP